MMHITTAAAGVTPKQGFVQNQQIVAAPSVAA